MPIRWATTPVRVTGLLILLAATAGCTGNRPAAAPASTGTSAAAAAVSAADSTRRPEPARGCPPGGPLATVDYVDFLQANGRQYLSGLSGNKLTVSPASLGPAALQVRCSYAAANHATGRALGMPRDGDSAYLAAGTTVYEVRGCAVSPPCTTTSCTSTWPVDLTREWRRPSPAPCITARSPTAICRATRVDPSRTAVTRCLHAPGQDHKAQGSRSAGQPVTAAISARWRCLSASDRKLARKLFSASRRRSSGDNPRPWVTAVILSCRYPPK